jgi:DNA-directed RNA polymerase subunit RPC12/RpoP
MQNYNCQNCGAELYWDIDAKCLKCRYCDSEYQVSDFEDKTVTDKPVESEHLDSDYVSTTHDTEEMVVYGCKNCGGEVVALKTTMATICPYCGEAISITSKAVGEFRPQYCIPFKKTKEEIMEIYKNYVKSSFLAPKHFKENNVVEKIQGVFVPFHLHSIDNRAKHAYEGERTRSLKRGYDKITIHDVYHLSVDATGHFTRIPTDGSTKIANTLMESIEPFNYKECVAYNPGYMAGFLAEQTDDDQDEMKVRAETRSTSSMKEQARKQFVGYSSVLATHEDVEIISHESEYVLLPVWLLNVTHEGKKYTYAINGQTGKIAGKLPIGKSNVLAAGLGSFFLADLATALIMLFM